MHAHHPPGSAVRQFRGGGQPAISPCDSVPHTLVHPLVPGCMTTFSPATIGVADASRRGARRRAGIGRGGMPPFYRRGGSDRQDFLAADRTATGSGLACDQVVRRPQHQPVRERRGLGIRRPAHREPRGLTRQ